MTPIDVPRELADLRATLDAFVALREELGERAFERVPAVSAWSAAQHLYHLALSTDLALRNVAALARGEGARIVDSGGPNALALQVLAEGRYPRGRSEAPRMVRPGDDVDPAFLADEVRRSLEGLEGVAGLAAEIPGAPKRIPHHALGELDAAEWLRFAQLHARHHLEIVRDVAAALDDV